MAIRVAVTLGLGQDQLLWQLWPSHAPTPVRPKFVPGGQSAGFGAVSQSLKGCTQLQHSLYSAPGRRTVLMHKVVCTLDSVLFKAVFKNYSLMEK